ncbi:NDP-sugar synthase [Candidatus Bathyarchaeota archaeon]|nr:NDP-sugar synthase [Candidatus Bathyarchaeota archaeon]
MNGLKALILAGGFGTRLRPLSCTRPKLLFPVAGKPVIDWILQGLSKVGVETAILAVNYMAESFVRYLGPTKFNVGILYSREARPMGTGGPIKMAESLLRDSDMFLVLNGDVLSDLDYRRLIQFHVEKGGLATIALYRVEDPSRYGSVEVDGEGRIMRFVEKPEPGKAPSNLVNAGIYVFNREVLEYIPTGRRVSTEREVFPNLAKDGTLYGYEMKGLWIDIGVPEDYLTANRLLLSKPEVGQIAEGADIDEGAKILPPVHVGRGVEIGEDSVIGPYTSIGEDVYVGKGCRIEGSIIFPGAMIGDHTSIRNAIVGENATIERWVKIESGSLIGDYAEIADGVTITHDVTICPSKRVEESILEIHQVM